MKNLRKNIALMSLFLTFLLSLNLYSCRESDTNPIDQTDKADLVLHNGAIYTVNENQEWAEAIAVKDQKIIFIGNDAEVDQYIGDNTIVSNLNGKMVMPGIHDVHMHPLEAASNNFHFTVDGEEQDPENYAFDVTRAMNQNPGDGWLLGWGHFLHTVLEATRSPKEILDDVAPNRPVAIMELTSHSMWCNSRALELLGITIDSENPTGGIIMRDANDEPNGILIDNAGNLLVELALQPSTQSEENDYFGLIDFALPELAKHGITSICDARTYYKRNHHKTWQRIEAEGKLTARVNLGLWAYPNEDDLTQIATLKSLYNFNENSLLKINQIKLYADGIVHNTTAAMDNDYLVDLYEESTNNGLNYFTQSRLSQYIAALEGTGFDFHIHAIGNRGINEALNAIEESGSGNGRHRLTHLEIVNPSDYSRFNSLNITADCQVAGDFTHPDQWQENIPFIGNENSNNIIPLNSLKAANARITLSSDWDVSTLNPFVGLQNAVTRTPQELTLKEAIKAYTINAAYVMRQEDKVGSLEVGKYADMIVLNQNLFNISNEKISNTKVKATYLNGNKIF